VCKSFHHHAMELGNFLRRFVMENHTLRQRYVQELRDIYDAEKQLIKALPKMAEAAASEELRSGFEEHLERTKGHAERLEQIFNELGEKPTGKKCKGMQGLVSEASELIDEDFEGEVKDAGLISAAQRVEHYEIAAYGTLRAYATLLGEQNAVSLLEKTLTEEKQTDQKLTDLAEGINAQANRSDYGEERGDRPAGHGKAKAARAR
jgi:ferritin-like metal-binding protein YciE